MSHTFESVLSLYDITIPEGLVAQAEVPVIAGLPQRQGDVLIVPRGPLGTAEAKQAQLVPASGVTVVRGETGPSHILHAEGPCTWAPAPERADSVVLGVLDVPEDATAYLIHQEEHGANGIGTGTYTLHGKREQAEQIRRVAD